MPFHQLNSVVQFADFSDRAPTAVYGYSLINIRDGDYWVCTPYENPTKLRIIVYKGTSLLVRCKRSYAPSCHQSLKNNALPKTLSHHNSVCLSVGHTGGSVKNGAS